MARAVTVVCDACGKERPSEGRPKTWWVMEQQSEVMTTGALDFCSLLCLATWLADPRVTQHPAYAADFRKESQSDADL